MSVRIVFNNLKAYIYLNCKDRKYILLLNSDYAVKMSAHFMSISPRYLLDDIIFYKDNEIIETCIIH